MKRYGFMVWGFLCHFWIDFSCSWFIFQEVAGEAGWYTLLFFYNFFAFALELPLGVLLDRIYEKNKGSLIVLRQDKVGRFRNRASVLSTFFLRTPEDAGTEHPANFQLFCVI